VGPVKGLWPALGPPRVCFCGFQQGTPLLVIIIAIIIMKIRKFVDVNVKEQCLFSGGIPPKWQIKMQFG
jgi:hypothetical protein